jgi:CheY-like chemotaxis protein
MTSVLVVDDDPLMVRTLCDVLRRRGYQVGGASSGEEAVASAAQHAWSAVVIDFRMPGMNGIVACRSMRTMLNDAPLILMTAHSEAGTPVEATAAGISRILSKPFPIPDLLAALPAP